MLGLFEKAMQMVYLVRCKQGIGQPPFGMTSSPGTVGASREDLDGGLRGQEVRIR